MQTTRHKASKLELTSYDKQSFFLKLKVNVLTFLQIQVELTFCQQ